MANLSVDQELVNKAHACGINLSGLLRRCLAREIERIENETGAFSAKTSTPVTTPSGGQINVEPLR